jgi:hypothetical protein
MSTEMRNGRRLRHEDAPQGRRDGCVPRRPVVSALRQSATGRWFAGFGQDYRPGELMPRMESTAPSVMAPFLEGMPVWFTMAPMAGMPSMWTFDGPAPAPPSGGC